MRKNSFFTFCFACIPGAGQMYLGMMKRGVSLMLSFALIIAISSFFYLSFFMLVLPVLWFYAFFDTFNVRAMSYEERLAKDKFLLDFDGAFHKDWGAVIQKRHLLFGIGFILLGAYLLYHALVLPFLWKLEEYFPWLYTLRYNIPSFVVAVAVIVLGIRLVTGGKKAKPLSSLPGEPNDDFVEYGGNNDEQHQS